jgi:SAM-dependent methyltransferase
MITLNLSSAAGEMAPWRHRSRVVVWKVQKASQRPKKSHSFREATAMSIDGKLVQRIINLRQKMQALDLRQHAQRWTETRQGPGISYGTVRDFCDSVDSFGPFATLNHDMKDGQRCWMIKTLVSYLPEGARLLEIGAGHPYVADLMAHLGYEVWIVDPYNGSGHGPEDYDSFVEACPHLRFTRAPMVAPNEPELPPGYFDAVYSISVLEHSWPSAQPGIFAAIRNVLKPSSLSVHAVDHVLRGQGDGAHLGNLQALASEMGFAAEELDQVLLAAQDDIETYWLSAESHNMWRGSRHYDTFPMRRCMSVQLLGTSS